MKYLSKTVLFGSLFAIAALASGCVTEAEEAQAAAVAGEVLAPVPVAAPTAYVPRGRRGGGGGGGWNP